MFFIPWIHSIYLNNVVFFWPQVDNVLMTIFMTSFFCKTLLLTSIKWKRKCSWTYCLLIFSFPRFCTKNEVFHSGIFQKMWPNLQFWADLVTFTEEILHKKLHFSFSESLSHRNLFHKTFWGTTEKCENKNLP